MGRIEVQSENNAPEVLRSYTSTLPGTMIALSIIAVLAAILYAPVIRDLAVDWWQNPDYSYGFLVPVFSGYVLFRQRFRYREIAKAPSGAGLAVIVVSVALLIAGTLAADYYTSRSSLVLLFAGLILFFAGRGMLSAMKFPLAYLMLMIPLPMVIFNEIAFPLQLLASQLAASMLRLVGLPALRDGNIIMVPHFSVEVAQACSGIRSLFSLVALAIGFAYLAESRKWVRVLLVVSVIPIAILTNGFRIMATALVGYRFGPEWAEGFTHAVSGWLVFLMALGLMFVTHSLLTVVRERLERKAHA